MFEQEIKNKAYELGFDICGITSALEIEKTESDKLFNWLNKGLNADLGYMERNVEKRISAGKLLEDAKSVICVGIKYDRLLPDKQADCTISSYACYEDYHSIIKPKLFALAEFINTLMNERFKFKACVDTVPIAERSYAQKAGLGFIGKNRMLINKLFGSRIFLGELITNLELKPDAPIAGDCRKCSKCIDACPTGALTSDGIDCNKCISYLTIENRGQIDKKYHKLVQENIFGCDKCVDACPFNENTPLSSLKKILNPGLISKDILEMSTDEFETVFGKSPLSRAGIDKLKTHIKYND
ncbi:MAG: tRNA epoxyqueuosine(34) reductase QueG [Sedimentisphaeraceae bacterium JB056]